MTDATLTKYCEKKINEACAKLPNEKRRVLAALLAVIVSAQKKAEQ